MSYAIGVETLNIGQTVEVVYLSPDKGRVSVNLRSGNGDHVLHVDARYEWKSWKNALVLNSAVGHNWQKTERETPSGFPFTWEGVPTTIVLRITVHKGFFNISANGVEIAPYRFRESLHPSTVNKIEYVFEDVGATEKKAKLESITVKF